MQEVRANLAVRTRLGSLPRRLKPCCGREPPKNSMGRGPRISILPAALQTATQTPKLYVRKELLPRPKHSAGSTKLPTPECTTRPYCASGRPVWIMAADPQNERSRQVHSWLRPQVGQRQEDGAGVRALHIKARQLERSASARDVYHA
eukprot:5591632-Amphidinium_carterae.1